MRLVTLVAAGIFFLHTCTAFTEETMNDVLQSAANNIAESNGFPTGKVFIVEGTHPNIAYRADKLNSDIMITYGLIMLSDNIDELAFEFSSMFAILYDTQCSQGDYSFDPVLQILKLGDLQGNIKEELCLDVKALRYMTMAGYDPYAGPSILDKLAIANDNDASLIRRYLFIVQYLEDLNTYYSNQNKKKDKKSLDYI